MNLLSKITNLGEATIPIGIDECSEPMRVKVLHAAAKHGLLIPGEVILYIELKLFPYPHLVNCTVTVPPRTGIVPRP